MGSYLSVRNWDEFQHYKDRNPPWIKLHKRLLHDYEFSCLQDASKAHLILIWLLASQVDNQIPNDPDWIKAQTGIKGKLDLNVLITHGFLIDSNPLAVCKQSATHSVSVSVDSISNNKRTSSKKRATQIHAGWQPTEKTLKWAVDEFPHIDAPEEVEPFIDYWISEGKGKADWNATFKNRIRSIDKWMKKNGTPQHGTHQQTPRETASQVSDRKAREAADALGITL